MMIKSLLAVLLSASWISVCEFLRNQHFLRQIWINHFSRLGLNFPDEPLNKVVWIVWAFFLAYVIFFLSKKLAMLETMLCAWLVAFPMLWLALWNLKALPVGILFTSTPLSLLEVYGATWLIYRVRFGKTLSPSASVPAK